MLKKKNLIFLSLLVLGVLLLTSCFLNPPVTEGILKGQVIVPEGSKQTKDLTGQALADATVNIIDLATGDIIATTTTDANGYYQVFVPAGGPYLLEAVKDEVKVQQITCQVEVGIEYDLGIADCSTTAVALIALAMMDAGANLADINLAEIEADPNFDNVLSNVTSIIEAGGDPTESAAIQQAVEDFLSPPAPAPPPPTPTYTVTFDKNDTEAVGTMAAQTITSGSSVNLTACGFTKEDWTFTGWAITPDGAVAYTDEASYTMGSSNVTLYAKWTPTYTVTFDSQGGTVVVSQTVAEGGKVAEPVAPTRTGYTFVGWYKESGCTNAWDFDTDTVMANVTLYAKWTINTYTVTYDGNGNTGGTVPSDTNNYEYGAIVAVLENTGTLVKTDRVFDGWNTQTDGNGVNRAPGSTFNMGSENVTLYAQWTIDRYVSTTGDNANIGSFNSPWLTIQHALDNAPSGGTVHVSDGTYTEKITFPSTLDTDGGRVIVLKSENGAESTKINEVYQSGGFIVTLDSCPDGTTLDGFTITTEALNKSTGGILINNCSPTIENNTISGNAATRGAGIYILYSDSPIIQNNTISGNTAIHTDYGGGGIYILYSDSPIIQNNTISGNETASRGGGIHINHSSPTIQNNTIELNISSNRGGGIYIHYDSSGHDPIVIQNNTISENTSYNCGGGIYSAHSSPTIQDNTISLNIATYEGGGISISGSATIKNNTISDNSVEKGGGISISGSATIKNNTISRNIASGNNILGGGGGIYIKGGSPTIQDNTILENIAYYGGGIYISNVNASSSPTIQNNTISGNTTSDDGGGIYIFSTSGSPTIGGASVTDTANFNTVCGNTPDQINPDSYPNNYIFTNCDVIGEIGPAGGLIFYDKGSYSDGWRYLEAAPASTEGTSKQWGSDGTLIGGTGTGIGTGQSNTTTIVTWLNSHSETDKAAQICDALTEAGYSDWFLPSQDELNLVYTNLKVAGVGGFADFYYWSSSEYNAGIAWGQNFGDGFQYYYDKYNTSRVRAVRAF